MAYGAFPNAGKMVIAIVSVDKHGEAKLAHVAGAANAARVFLRLAQCRQEQRGEDRDNGNNDEQFNQGEAGTTFAPGKESWMPKSDHQRPFCGGQNRFRQWESETHGRARLSSARRPETKGARASARFA